MRIIIHRGSDQIGGCITEIRTAKSKILIDLGRNLPQGDRPADDEMDNAEAIQKLCEDCDAVFYTHYHGDHINLFRHVPASVPQYIGPLAKRVMQTKLKRLARIDATKTASLARLDRFHTYNAAQRRRIGKDILVTPYFVSHSAADAYMFLIEAEGKRILHTGDFRGHGYLGRGLMKVLTTEVVPQGVDVLICEGTMLRREDEEIRRESELQLRATEVMRRYKNVFVLCSSTDIDRLATFHAANRQQLCRPLVCDRYQGDLLQLFSETAGSRSPLFAFTHKVIASNERNENLRDWMLKDGFTMLVRISNRFRHWVETLLPLLNPDETVLCYSMFRGYILPSHSAFKPQTKAFVDLFPNIEYLHTSGHASATTLAEVCRTVRPRMAIVPIHREEDSDFSALDIGDDLRRRIVATESCTMDGIEFIIKKKRSLNDD